MKQKMRILLVIGVIGILLVGCDAIPDLATPGVEGDTSGAQTWIEFPREGQVLPNEETTFMVYSTAADGVSSIGLKLNGEALPATGASGLSTDGSKRMVRLDQTWIPPGEGEYTLEAATGSGSSAIKFCIVTCAPGEVQAPAEVIPPTELTPSPTTEVSGTPQLPTATLTPTLTQTFIPTFTATVKPTLEPTLTDLPPADTSGPSVNSVGTFWEGCSLYGTANITDPSGVIWAEFWFNHNGEGWAWILMNQNGDQWVSQVGVDTGGLSGTLEYKVRTEDSLHNEAWSGVFTKNYEYCGE
ncbi:MAG: hypothetical protein K8R77_15335 [Anaerolineaceae bacterium]|nr:hypothetical protein [Anaerolineaceae bacterium]